MAIEDGERKGFHGANQKKAMGPQAVPLNDEKLVLLWLMPLLRANFFAHCAVHAESNTNECNHYCLDCSGDALCSSCLPMHRDHRIVQIRRSSYHNVIKASEMSKFIDISSVQTYIINSAKIVFLNERPQARSGKGVTYACEICCRPLHDLHRFCSIGCKLRGMTQDQRATVALSWQSRWWSVSVKMFRSLTHSAAAKSAEECGGESSNVGSARNSVDSVSQAVAPIASHRRLRRKGTPRRATF